MNLICIFDDIPPQMKILNIAIPILMHFCNFISILSVTRRIIQPHKSYSNWLSLADISNDAASSSDIMTCTKSGLCI